MVSHEGQTVSPERRLEPRRQNHGRRARDQDGDAVTDREWRELLVRQIERDRQLLDRELERLREADARQAEAVAALRRHLAAWAGGLATLTALLGYLAYPVIRTLLGP